MAIEQFAAIILQGIGEGLQKLMDTIVVPEINKLSAEVRYRDVIKYLVSLRQNQE